MTNFKTQATIAAVKVVSVAIFSAQSALAANLISDPGFESNSVLGTGWVFTPSLIGGSGCGGGGVPDVGITNQAHTGSFSAYKNCFRNTDGTIEQVVATIPGHKYEVSFWLANNQIQSGGTLSVTFGQAVGLPPSSDHTWLPWSNFTFSSVATASTTKFSYFGSVPGGTFFLDDVSVVDVGPAVPEPGSAALLISGLAVVLVAARRLHCS